jgi:hypothetical protein
MSFKINVKLTARMMEYNQHMDEINFSRRGCECQTNEAAKRRMKNKNRSIAAVLRQPFLQQKEYAGKEESILSAYARASSQSAVSAYMIGLLDEKTARYGNAIKE